MTHPATKLEGKRGSKDNENADDTEGIDQLVADLDAENEDLNP